MLPIRLIILNLTFFLLLVNSAKSQQKNTLESLIPPAPNAAELAKYGTYPVGTLTGIPEIDFPLFEIKSGKLSLPINLSYHASGILVNQKSTDVGLGWSIFAGGTISRVVYGTRDDAINGYFNYDPPTLEDLHGIDDFSDLEAYNFNPGLDLEPDLFVYNMAGKSGKFLFSKEKEFLTIPYSPIRISKELKNGKITFKIIDENGVTYNFDESCTTTNDEYANPQKVTISTWYLTSILSADQTDEIIFEYEQYFSEDLIENHSYPIGRGLKLDPNQSSYSISTILIRGDASGLVLKRQNIINYSELLLKKVIFKNGSLVFNRNTPRKDANPVCNSLDEIILLNSGLEIKKKVKFVHDYFISTNFINNWAHHRLKLTGFIVEDINSSNNTQVYNFEYNETPLPPYGSYNIDYWGFSNGATSNVDLIPNTTVYLKDINNTSFADGLSYSNGFIGQTESHTLGGAYREPSAEHMKANILQRISYPTGGYTRFEFEPHKYESDEYEKHEMDIEFESSGIDKFTLSSTVSDLFIYPSNPNYNDMNDFDVVANLAINFSASHMGNTEFGKTQVVSLISNNQVIGQWEHTGELTNALIINIPILITKGMNLKLKHEIYGNPEVKISSSFSWHEKTDENLIKFGGGLRINSIENYSSVTKLATKTIYKYGIEENELGIKLFEEECFYRNYEDIVSDYYVGIGTYNGFCEQIGNGNKWVRNYLGFSKYNSVSFLGSPILYAEVSQYEGTDEENAIKTIFKYDINSDQFELPKEFLNSGNYGTINTAWFQGELRDVIKYKYKDNIYSPVVSNHYDYTGFNQKVTSGILFKQYNINVNLTGCEPLNPNTLGGRPGLAHFSMYEYPIKTGIRKLIKETKKEYSSHGVETYITTITDYDYQNSNNRFLTSIVSSTSRADDILNITKYRYPQDFNDPVAVKMTEKNYISPIIEEKKYISVSGNETLLSTKIENYKIGDKDMILKDELKYSQGNSAPELRIKYEFDDSGNLVQQSFTDNINIA